MNGRGTKKNYLPGQQSKFNLKEKYVYTYFFSFLKTLYDIKYFLNLPQY